MATIARDDREKILKPQYVEEYVRISGEYRDNLFKSVKIQTLQLEDLSKRISNRIATVDQVSTSFHNIKTDLVFYNRKITKMATDRKEQQLELGAPFPIDDPQNTLENLEGMIAKLNDAVPALDAALPQVEKDDEERRKREGHTLFAVLAISIVGMLVLRSYMHH